MCRSEEMTRRASGVIKAEMGDVMAATRRDNSSDDRVMRGLIAAQGLLLTVVERRGMEARNR